MTEKNSLLKKFWVGVWLVCKAIRWLLRDSNEVPDKLLDADLHKALAVKLTNDKQQGVFCSALRFEHVFSPECDWKRLYTSTDDRAMVIGPPGTGKTAFLITQIYHWSRQRLRKLKRRVGGVNKPC